MIKELIKIANELDTRGLESEADQLDLIIIRAADTGSESEVSLDTDDAIRQKIGKKIIKALGLSRIAPFVHDIGTHPTFESWITSLPKSVSKVIIGSIIIEKAGKAIFGLREYAPLAALAIGVPALAEINFSSMKEPSSKLIDQYIRVNRKCLYKDWFGGAHKSKEDCNPRPLTDRDYESKDIKTLEAIKNGEAAEIRDNIFTGTPPEILAYAFLLGATGDIRELLELKNREEPIIDDSLFSLIRDAGNEMRRQTISFQIEIEKLIKYLFINHFFPDMLD